MIMILIMIVIIIVVIIIRIIITTHKSDCPNGCELADCDINCTMAETLREATLNGR